MFIIEGSDCVGKTTLAHKIVKSLNDLGWPHVYQHMTKLPACWGNDAMCNYRRLMNPYVVMDRFHMSESLYAQAREDQPFLTSSMYAQLDRELLNFSVYVLVISAPSHRIKERYEPQREMYDLDKVFAVNDDYQYVGKNGVWQTYNMRVDQHFGMDRWPEVRDIGLRAYTLRLQQNFPYQGATVA